MSLYERNGSPHLWCVFQINGQRYRRSTGTTSKLEAKAFEAALRTEVKDAPPPEKTGPRSASETRQFEIVLLSYLEDRGRRGKRLDSYRKLTDWREVFKGRDVDTITLPEVEAQPGRWMDDRGWSRATYNNSLSQLSGLLAYAFRKGWTQRHELQGRVERMDPSNARERYLRLHEIETIRAASAPWLSRLVLAGVALGLRRGALCALRVRDLDFDEHGNLRVIVGKDKNGRKVHKRLAGELLGIVTDRMATARPEDFLFPGPSGGSAYRPVEKHLRRAVESVGLEWGLYLRDGDGNKEPNPNGITFHSLRHTFASQLQQAGVSEAMVQKMGNWKTPSMTRRYTHLADEQIRRAEDTLANLLDENYHTTTTLKPSA